MIKKEPFVIIAVFAGICLAAASPGGAAEASMDKTADDTDLKRLAWLAGRWEGAAFGGVCEETWSHASAGTMVGTFKLVVDGAVSFYEFCLIQAEAEGPVMKLKHFNPDLTGWEEKDSMIVFPFEQMTDSEIRFSGLAYRQLSADSLQITINLRRKSGEAEEHKLLLRRAGD